MEPAPEPVHAPVQHFATAPALGAGTPEARNVAETGRNPSSSVLFVPEADPPKRATTDPAAIRADASRYGINWNPPRKNSFWIPTQAKKNRHIVALKIMGRIGWGAKAVIYAMIGGLACQNAVSDRDVSASPEGAFVLIGTVNGGRGLLIFFAICILTYSAWRFWEGFIGQGYDNNFPKWKNFFKFRLSPIVSGSVYLAYDVLVFEVVPRDDDSQRRYLSNKNWPNSWRGSAIGRTGLIFIGIAFIAATLVQIEQFFTKSIHNTIRHAYPYMKREFWRPFRIFVLTTGHIGVLGRAGVFLFAAILFFRTVHGETETGKSAFGNALAQLQNSRGGKAALFIMGAFTVCYGLFSTLNIYARIFPTPPPSGVKKAHDFEFENGSHSHPAFSPDGSGFHPLSGPSNRRLNTNAVPPNSVVVELPQRASGSPKTESVLDTKEGRSSNTSTSDDIPEPKEGASFHVRDFSPMSNHLQSQLGLQGNHPTRR